MNLGTGSKQPILVVEVASVSQTQNNYEPASRQAHKS